MKPRLLFELPALRRPTAASFKTQPEAVGAWLAGLPLASVGETCRQIFVSLYEVNRTKVPLTERLEFLERLAEPLVTVLPALQRHFIGQPFPLSEKAHHVARLSTDLQVELVIGYRLVLEGVRHLPWYRRWGRGRHKALAAHRMLHYLSNILSDYQWLHLPYPRGVWRVVHGLFVHEERLGRAAIRVGRLAGSDATSTVVDEYKRLLLRALVPPARIHVEQWRYLNRQLDGWLPLVALDATSVESGYLVRLDRDGPPTELPVDLQALIASKERFTIFNTRPLVERLDTLLADKETPLPASLTRETVQMLRNVWGSTRGRHAERRQGRGQTLEVVAGIHAIHRLLTDGDGHRDTVVLALEEIEGESISGAGGPHGKGKRATLAPKSWANNDSAELPRVLRAKVVDHSDSGYGLQLAAADVAALKEGELIGLRASAQHPWEVGYACWLHVEQNEQLALGVQHLATEVLPVEVSVGLHEGHSAPIGCLLGTTASAETALFIPHLSGVEDKTLQLGYRSHRVPISLLERLDGSAEFNAYLFDAPTTTVGSQHTSMMSEDERHQRSEAPLAAATEASRFADIWPAL